MKICQKWQILWVIMVRKRLKLISQVSLQLQTMIVWCLILYKLYELTFEFPLCFAGSKSLLIHRKIQNDIIACDLLCFKQHHLFMSVSKKLRNWIFLNCFDFSCLFFLNRFFLTYIYIYFIHHHRQTHK